jgi:hypothetical protein
VAAALSLASLSLLGTSCAAGEAIEETAGSVADQMEDGIAAVPVANQTVCDIERTTLATAFDAYVAITGSAPMSEADLVSEGLLRTEVQSYDVDPTGAIVPAPGSTCT